MKQITIKNLITNIVLFVLYVIFSIITYIVTDDFLHFFLIWNLILAAIPYAISFFIDHEIIATKVGVIIASFLWLFFFPNSIYIITDLIYIDVEDFAFNGGYYSPTQYLQDISSYLGLFHIYLGSILGLVYGLKSLSVMYNLSKKTILLKCRNLLILLVFLLSSIGIYIGRFFRYNSWEFFKLFQIAKDFFTTFTWFTLFFILVLTLIQVIISYAIKINFIKDETPIV